MMHILFFLLLVTPFFASAGKEQVFTVPFAEQGDTRAINATLRIVVDRPGRLPIKIWLENEQWESTQLNGLNTEFIATDLPSTNLQDDRYNNLQEFADWLNQEIITPIENTYFQFTDPSYTNSSGLNLLFTDIKDNYAQTGSFIGAHFFPADQAPAAGFNSMNLIYIDCVPGTIGYQIDEKINKKTTYREIMRNIVRLLLYQIAPNEKEIWLQEGLAQFFIYRLLGSSKTFPYTPTRILGAPEKAVPEVDQWLTTLFNMKLGYPFLTEHIQNDRAIIQAAAEKNLDRVFIRSNPNFSSDNIASPYFRGFSYLFFTYLFHYTGGNFQKSVTDGDRFYQELIKEKDPGFAGLENALTKKNQPDLRTIYTEFYLSLFLNVTENRLKKNSYHFAHPDLQQFTLIDTMTQPDQFTLNPWAMDFRIYQNPHDVLWEGNINIIPRFEYTKIFVLNKDATDNFFVEEELGEHRPYFFIPAQEKKYLLFINLDSIKKTQRIEIGQKNYQQRILVPNSNKKFGSVTTEILIDSSIVPSYGQTGSISLSLPQSGIYDFYVNNDSSTPLLWSVEKNIYTSNLIFDSSQRISRSVLQSSLHINHDKRLLQKQNSREKFIFAYPYEQKLDFNLYFTALDPDEFTEQAKKSTGANDTIGTQERDQYAGGGMSGCFIATAAYGGKNHSMVLILSNFRDVFLLTHKSGQAFVYFYYRYSPKIAKIISQHLVLRFITALLLLPFVLFALVLLAFKSHFYSTLFGLFCLFNVFWLIQIRHRQKLLTQKGKISMFLIILFFLVFSTHTKAAVGFKNDDPNPARKGHASLQIKEIARTLGRITENCFNILEGIELAPAYSNKADDPPVINVFLYDIRDGQSSVDQAVAGYFSPFDQLRTNGTSLTNEISNFGNVIYLDLNPYDPSLDISSIPNRQLTKNTLFGHKFYFYQNYAAVLLELLMFQQQNQDYTGDGFYYSDYKWITNGLGSFAAFRFGKSVKLCDEPNSNDCKGAEIFNTSSVDQNGLPIVPMMPYPTTRFLHFNHRQTETKLYPLPGLFHTDFAPGVPKGSSIQEKEYNDIATGISYLFFLYLWEQLEKTGQKLGDTFIIKLIQEGSKNFYVNQRLSADKIYDPQPYAHDPIPENNSATGFEARPICQKTQDKICQINYILRLLTDENPDYTPKTFEEYYLDFIGATMLNQKSIAVKPELFEIKNIDLKAAKRKNTDISYNNPKLNFDTGNNPNSIDFTWTISGEDLRKLLTEIEEGKEQQKPEESGGGSPEDLPADGTAVEINEISADMIPLSTFSFATVLVNNANPSSDLRFPYGDIIDQEDNGVEDRTANSVMAQLFRKGSRIRCNDLDPFDPNACIFDDQVAQKGKGYFVIPRTSTDSIQTTGITAFVGLKNTGVKFQEPTANFSRMKITSPDDPETPIDYAPHYHDMRAFFDDWRTYFMQEIEEESLLQLSVGATGVKTYNGFQPIYKIKDSEEWQNSPVAFRNYMHSFKTFDLERSTADEAYIERRTAVLKEIINVPEVRPRWRLFLWVDQRNLPDSDSSTIPMEIETDVETEIPPSPDEQKKPNVSPIEIDRIAFSDSKNREVNKFETTIKVSGLKSTNITFKNRLDIPITIQFFLTNGSLASEVFELDSDSYRSETYVITRNSVSKTTDRINEPITIPEQSQHTISVRSKVEGNIEKELVIAVRKSVSLSTGDSSGQEHQGGGASACFIATATYGQNHEKVVFLSAFRDQVLLKSSWGSQFVELYYKYSPALAKKINPQGFNGRVSRFLLDSLISGIQLFFHPVQKEDDK